ncbi:MAG TPA: DNA starvation/stationary phase protection protein [Opitutaceae bacterium]|nr:DNA starvation/stationary phase protection protein [Opitutaceae bacterium]
MNIGLTDQSRHEIGEILNLILADETVLYLATRDYHWNVTGIHFFTLHKLLEKQYEEIAEKVDDIAERARSIGVGAQGNFAILLKAARLSADPGAGLAAENMIAGLLDLHEDMVVQLRLDVDVSANRYNDAGTADFLTGLMEYHEKTAWMLRALLEDETAETS